MPEKHPAVSGQSSSPDHERSAARPEVGVLTEEDQELEGAESLILLRSEPAQEMDALDLIKSARTLPPRQDPVTFGHQHPRMPSLTKQLRTLILLLLAITVPAQDDQALDKLLQRLPDNSIAWAAVDDLPVYYERLLQTIGPMPEDAPPEVKALLPLAQLGIRAALGRPLEDALYEVAAGPVVFGLVAGDDGPIPVLAMEVQDEGSARRLLEKFIPKASHAFEEGVLLLSQNEAGLEMLRRGASKARQYDRGLHLHLDLDVLRTEQGDGRKLLDNIDPFGRFIIGPLVAALDASEHIDLVIVPSKDQLLLHAKSAGIGDSPLADLLAIGGQRSIPAAPSGTVAFVSLDRSLAALFREMDRVLSEEGAVQAKSFLSIADQILGAAFDTDLLAKLREPMHFYVIDMGPGDEYGPKIQLPAFVLVAKLGDARAAEKILRRGGQGLFFIVNIERGREGKKQLRLRPQKNGVAVEFPDWEGDSAPPTEYALSPALLFTGEHAILASSKSGAEAMAASLAAKETLQMRGDQWRVFGPELAQVLDRNFEILKLNRILDEGEAPAAAGRFFKVLSLVLNQIESANFAVNLAGERMDWVLDVRRK